MQNAFITSWNASFGWQHKHVGETSKVDLLPCRNHLLIRSTWLFTLGTWNRSRRRGACVQLPSITWSVTEGHDESQHSFRTWSSSICLLDDFHQLLPWTGFSPEGRGPFPKCCPMKRACFSQTFQSLEHFHEIITWALRAYSQPWAASSEEQQRQKEYTGKTVLLQPSWKMAIETSH